MARKGRRLAFDDENFEIVVQYSERHDINRHAGKRIAIGIVRSKKRRVVG